MMEASYSALVPTLPITIRPAQSGDAHALAQAERTIAKTPGMLVSRPDELLDEHFADKIRALTRADNGQYLVAEWDGDIVGHGLLDPLPRAAVRHVVHLTLVIHAGWQGKGIGRALLTELVTWAEAAAAVEKIELHVRSSNDAAQALYRGLGFVEVGRWKRRIKLGPDHYLDDVAMERFVS